MDLYQSALVLDPQSNEIYSDLGYVLTELGNFGATAATSRIHPFTRSLFLTASFC